MTVSMRLLAFMIGALAVVAMPAAAAFDPTAPQLRPVADAAIVPPDGEYIAGLTAPGDVTGDGRDDLLVLTSFEQGRARAFGRVLWLLPGGDDVTGVKALTNPSLAAVRLIEVSSEAGLLFPLGGLGDVDGDGIDDFALRGPSNMLTVIRGRRQFSALGDLSSPGPGHIRVINAPRAQLAPVGDTNGDGISDLLLIDAVSNDGAIVVRDDRTVIPGRSQLGDIDAAAPPSGSRRVSVLAPRSALSQAFGDYNADGLADLAITTSQPTPGAFSTRFEVHVLWGAAARSSAVIAPGGAGVSTYLSQEAGQSVPTGWTTNLVTWDANRDGIDDLLLSGLTESRAMLGGSGFGSPPLAITRPEFNFNGGVPRVRIDAPGDLDGDGHADLLVRQFSERCADSLHRAYSAIFPSGQSVGPGTGASRPVVIPGAGFAWDAYAKVGPLLSDVNGDSRDDIVMTALPFSAAGAGCARRENVLKITFGARPPICAGPAIPTGAALDDFVRGASLRRARRANVRLSVAQLRVNQRTAAEAIRRLNAVRGWLDAGVQGRDICGDAIASEKFAPGATSAAQTPTERSAPDPRSVGVADARGQLAEMTLGRSQLLINQRIYQAAIARANALAERMSALTGGDVVDGSIDARALRGEIAGFSGAAEATPASTTVIVPPRQSSVSGLEVTKHQLVINQRIATEVLLRAKNLQGRLEAGLIGENFADGSLTPVDLGS